MSTEASGWPFVSVIIPTYRRYYVTLDTVDEVLRQDYLAFELIVVDQNPRWPEDCHARLRQLKNHPALTWIFLDEPGVVRARNVAVSHSKGEVLLFVDDDVILQDPHFIRKHAENYVSSDIDTVTAYELTRSNEDLTVDIEKLKGIRDFLSKNSPTPTRPWSGKNPLQDVLSFPRTLLERYEVCSFCTCNGSIRRSSFYDLGGFDANYIGNSYGDDYDLAIRARQHGMRMIYDPLPSLLHLQSPTGGLRISDRGNTFSERDRAISAWIFVLRYFRFGMVGHLLWAHLLRKTVLVKSNLVHPWRQLKAWGGFAAAFPRALIAVIKGPTRGV